MSFALFLLLLSVPLGVLITVTPAWVLEDGTHERASTPSTPLPSTDERSTPADSSDHPATCLAIAAHRATAYHAFIGVRRHLEDLDPMTWLVAGHLRDRFETAMLAAIGAVDDWLDEQATSTGIIDAGAAVERERLRETLAELIGSLPAFSAGVGWEHHYRIASLQRLQGRLETLAAGVERHRQVALHPPAAPFR
jgi:hypothetical protein